MTLKTSNCVIGRLRKGENLIARRGRWEGLREEEKSFLTFHRPYGAFSIFPSISILLNTQREPCAREETRFLDTLAQYLKSFCTKFVRLALFMLTFQTLAKFQNML